MYRRALLTVLAAVNDRAKIGSGLVRSGPGGLGWLTTVLITVAGVADAPVRIVKSTGKFGTWPSGVRASERGYSTTLLKCWTEPRSTCTHLDGLASCVVSWRLMYPGPLMRPSVSCLVPQPWEENWSKAETLLVSARLVPSGASTCSSASWMRETTAL